MAKPYKFSFSYSRWSDWRKCPAMFKYKHVDKIDTGPPGPALIKGREVHDNIANWLKRPTGDMPSVLSKNFKTLGNALAELPSQCMEVEKQMSFDNEAKPVSWFSPDSYTRFIWDVLVTDQPRSTDVTKVTAVDWKTGRPYGSYDDQMQIFSIPAFWTYPKLETFDAALLYLDTGDDKDFSISREMFYDVVERTWVNNIRMMEADVSYVPTPSKDACVFCDFGPKKLGLCAVGVQ